MLCSFLLPSGKNIETIWLTPAAVGYFGSNFSASFNNFNLEWGHCNLLCLVYTLQRDILSREFGYMITILFSFWLFKRHWHWHWHFKRHFQYIVAMIKVYFIHDIWRKWISKKTYAACSILYHSSNRFNI